MTQSTAGQAILNDYQRQEAVVESVAQAVRALGERPTREGVAELAARYADDDERLQALTVMARPLMDEAFFTVLNRLVGSAPSADRSRLGTGRDQLRAFVQQYDAEQAEEAQDMLKVLTAIINAPEPEAAIAQMADTISPQMLQVMAVNIQEAERQGATAAVQAMRRAYEAILRFLEEQAPPEVRLLNRLVNAATPAEEARLLAETGALNREALLAYAGMMLEEIADARDSELYQRLSQIRARLAAL